MKEIFIATLGSRPEIITLCLWALKQRNFNIQDVLVLHTQPKIKDLVESINLLNTAFDTDNRLREYNYRLEPLLGDRGPIIDITSVVEAEQAANALFRVVKRFKLEHRRIHLYVVGGRKILAAYGMVVAQMLFDDEDKLWYSTSNEQLYDNRHLFPEPGDEFYLIDVPIIPAIRHLPLQTKLTSAETIDQALQTEKTIRRQERFKQIDLFLNEVLTDAQRQIVLLMTQGLGNKEIAYQRKVQRNTVDKQLSEVYKKWTKFWEIETAPHPRTQIITEVARYLSWCEGRS